MQTLTRIVASYLLSRRTLPLFAAIVIGVSSWAGTFPWNGTNGMNGSIVAFGQDTEDELAPVLRLARPYPALKAPPVTPAKSAQPEPIAPAQDTTTSDGWVARGMIGKKIPLSDPPQPSTLAPEIPAGSSAPRKAAESTENGQAIPNDSEIRVKDPEFAGSIGGNVNGGWQPSGLAPERDLVHAKPLANRLPADTPQSRQLFTEDRAQSTSDAQPGPSQTNQSQSSSLTDTASISDAVQKNERLRRVLEQLRHMQPVARMESSVPAMQDDTVLAESGEREAGNENAISDDATKAADQDPIAVPPWVPVQEEMPSLVEEKNEPLPTEAPVPENVQNGLASPRLEPVHRNSSRRQTGVPVGSPRVDEYSVDTEEGLNNEDILDRAMISDNERIERRAPIRKEEDDIPVRRPNLLNTENTVKREAAESTNPDRNSRARDLQRQIEAFERGDAATGSHSASEAIDDTLDSTVEPLPETSRAEPKRIAEVQRNPAPIISSSVKSLDQPIRQVLAYYHQRPENAAKRTPWGMLHAILPFDVDANVDAGRRYNAIAYLAGNNPNRNLRMLTTTRGGRIVARSGVGLQGHQAQMLAIFAQVGVPANYPLYVNNRKFVMNDLVQTEMLACKSGEELTFTLIGLSHYLPTDTRWRAADGQNWDFEKLIKEELSQPVVGAACGGTHRLMGLSYALRQRKLEGLPVTGQWARAEVYINDFVEYAWQMQNRDGSFSTEWFEGRADDNDPDRKLQTTGHILEWLLFVTEDDHLQDERVVRSIRFLTTSLTEGRNRELQVGPKGHALRALSVFHRRVFQSDRPWLQTGNTASRPSTENTRRR